MNDLPPLDLPPLDLSHRLDELLSGRDLTEADTEAVIGALVAGALDPAMTAAFLAGLRAKGETPGEIAGAVRALRRSAAHFPRPAGLFVDTCGTGGDGLRTVNVSTAVALVVAEAGVPVAKHGNRSVTSSSGSADVLEACGVRLDPPAELARRCLDTEGICFLFAPQYHAGLRHAMPVRRALGVRTLFNLIGPLSSPAAPPVQLVGVYDPALCVVVAETLSRVGCERALVVHGGGLDEVALHAPTVVARLLGGRVELLEITPEDAGIRRQPLAALLGGDPGHNAAWLRTLLAGEGAPAHVDMVALNAGAVLWIAGAAADLRDGVALARRSIEAGGAASRLARLAALSRGAAAGDPETP